MTLALMGEGEFVVDGVRQPAAAVLQQHGITPLALQAKEGLALINGTQTSAALALHALFCFEPVLESALVVGALTVDAARGSDGPFDPRIHALRGQPGQIVVDELMLQGQRRGVVAVEDDPQFAGFTGGETGAVEVLR